jgi:hypothetical protein
MKNKLLFLFTAIVALSGCINEVKEKEIVNVDVNINSEPAVDTTTRVRIVNLSNHPVVVWITLGATSGCLQHITQIPFITDSVTPLKGYFTLASNDSTIDYAPPLGIGYNGAVSFDTCALNCAIPRFPYGINLFEFIVNNSFQTGIPQETIEISCVAGCNALIEGYLWGDGLSWNTYGHPVVKHIYNRGKWNNSGLLGVFPFGCDDCTSSVSPPECDKSDKDKQKEPICTIQRNAKGSGGGLVRIVYKGTPPQPAK